jgi:hypothetical protein
VDVFVKSPYRVISKELAEQIKFVRATVPPGAAIVYIAVSEATDPPTFWSRSLYPDYTVILMPAKLVGSGYYQNVLRQHYAAYALAPANLPIDPGFEWRLPLPVYAGGPTFIAKLHR